MGKWPITTPQFLNITLFAMGVSLRTLLLVPFVFQVIGITSLIGYLSYSAGQRAVADLAEQLMLETGERITQTLSYYFDGAGHLALGNRLAIELKTLNWQDLNLLAKYFVKQLHTHPSIGSLAIAKEDQDFLAVVKTTPDRFVIHRHNRATGKLDHSVVDQYGNILYQRDSSAGLDLHDALINPWYKTAQDSAAGAWLPVVSSVDGRGTPELQMARFEPFVDAEGVQGVFSAAFSFDQIGHFLDQLKISETSQVFIVDEQGWLVATSTTERPFRQALSLQPEQLFDPSRWRLTAQESQDPVTRAVADWVNTLPEQSTPREAKLTSFRVNGQRYFGSCLPLTVDSQSAWTVVIAIPASDFTATIEANTRRTLLLISLGLSGSVVLGLGIVRRITHPLERLDQAIQDYATKGTFQPLATSKINEFDSLGLTLAQMVADLNVQKHHVVMLYTRYTQSLQSQVEAKTRELQAITTRLEEAQQIARMGSWEMDVATGKISCSASLLDLLGQSLPPDKLRYPNVLGIVQADDRSLLQAAVETGIREGLIGATEIRIPCPDGKVQHLVSRGKAIYGDHGQVAKLVGTATDITDRKQTEQELKALNGRLQALNARLAELATHDSLTQVANRRKMEQFLSQEWHRCQRETQPLSLILLDIDFFKSYNDYYGHPTGDWCLQQVAHILQSCMKRPGDLVARYGGEEFLLILANTNAAGATTLAHHIQARLADLAIPHAASAVSDHITVSLGIAVVNTIAPDLSCSEAIALADKALYQAKQVRNTFHVEVMS